MNLGEANVRTLRLPDGGTMDIPLPGSKARFSMRPGSMLSSPDGSFPVVPVMLGVVLGVALGVGATAWYMRRK